MKGETKSGVSTISLGRLQYIRWVTAGPTQKMKTHIKTLALDEGEFSTPHPGNFASGKGEGNHFTGGWVGPRAGLDGGRLHRDSIFGQSTLQRVAVPSELSLPTLFP
jgi:hypothetical protein